MSAYEKHLRSMQTLSWADGEWLKNNPPLADARVRPDFISRDARAAAVGAHDSAGTDRRVRKRSTKNSAKVASLTWIRMPAQSGPGAINLLGQHYTRCSI